MVSVRCLVTIILAVCSNILGASAFRLNRVFAPARTDRSCVSGSLCSQRGAALQSRNGYSTSAFSGYSWSRTAAGLLGAKMGGADDDENASLKKLVDKESGSKEQGLKNSIAQAEDMKEEIARKAGEVSSRDEKDADVGLSQFGASTETTTLQRGKDITRDEAGTMFADLSNRKLSYPALVLDRFLDGLEDGLRPKPDVSQVRCEEGKRKASGKPKLVVLGSGWGAHALMKSVDASKFDACVISPRNYFVFTPMLAGAATVEFRSITESIRDANPVFDYLEATATDVDIKKKVVKCQSVVCEGAECSIEDFEVPYDHLVVGVGASVNTFGIPGVKEHCYFLKQISDAEALRKAIGNAFERANIPDMSLEERIRTLTFVIAGAGPTGVEFTAELRDFIEQDVPKYYPNLLPYIRIKLVEASDRVLMQFESSMQQKAVQDLLNRPQVEGLDENYTELLLKSAVDQVTSAEIRLKDGTVIPYGIAVWAAGIGPLPLTLSLRDQIGEEQQDEQARGRLVCDRWLRVKGAPGVMAIGDCSTIDGYALPATAQVASQQGSYLGRLFSKEAKWDEVLPELEVDKSENFIDGIRRKRYAKPFQFLNLGILAYTGGDNALAEIDVAGSKIQSTGSAGWFLWRSAYFSKQVSLRNQLMVMFDWVKTNIFGRDLTRY
eukprot:CAMPEP_0177739360 /NCGR_PEP_ID=MMETSP0484_2-20121128/26984_1 /TAXON_ID=354590 /ORGANISM="Rhodomonas lens, Strain RHODO" /LENGTH=665 /DNA_ID=CAMNT_0019253417 /DNA_START=98 /DNA_END=2098 /DNA_ORIENTATION=+